MMSNIKWRFKDQYSLAQRKQESNNIRNKYPERIPVIVEKAPKSTLPNIDKMKFLVPKDITVVQFQWILRKRIQLPPEKAMFVFTGSKTFGTTSSTMGEMYNHYADEDGFLYMIYSGENTFGRCQSTNQG